ncbi:helix-turn-helix domain-containing protein [Streptomyces sp. NPDC059396]|uniref:helix-turn-helix domain-containing protein n=1 Tax=Streptomyces sp. NPDC059396 TaxID=3346819 RepID=UPI0036C3AEE5
MSSVAYAPRGLLPPPCDSRHQTPLPDPARPKRKTLARRAGLSTRHLSRVFNDQTGTTPAAYVESVRLEAAKALLEAGETVTAAARRAGLGTDESLRRTFLRHLGVPPSAYRARFRTTGAPQG